MCANKMLETFEISQPTLSYHMKILSSCGLVSSRKDGFWMMYSLRPDGYTKARGILENFEQGSLVGTLFALLPENNAPDTTQSDSSTRDLLYKLELELMRPNTRSNANRLSSLISDSFCEHTTSGQIYHYHVGATLSGGATYDGDWLLIDFAIRMLSDDTSLVTYKIVMNSQPDDSKKVTLRSSIWRIEGENWKLIFHQGTFSR